MRQRYSVKSWHTCSPFILYTVVATSVADHRFLWRIIELSQVTFDNMTWRDLQLAEFHCFSKACLILPLCFSSEGKASSLRVMISMPSYAVQINSGLIIDQVIADIRVYRFDVATLLTLDCFFVPFGRSRSVSVWTE